MDWLRLIKNILVTLAQVGHVHSLLSFFHKDDGSNSGPGHSYSCWRGDIEVVVKRAGHVYEKRERQSLAAVAIVGEVGVQDVPARFCKRVFVGEVAVRHDYRVCPLELGSVLDHPYHYRHVHKVV